MTTLDDRLITSDLDVMVLVADINVHENAFVWIEDHNKRPVTAQTPFVAIQNGNVFSPMRDVELAFPETCMIHRLVLLLDDMDKWIWLGDIEKRQGGTSLIWTTDLAFPFMKENN